jgi:hypothetical protein
MRAASVWKHPPLVLLSTDDVLRVPPMIRLGCDSVLLKPFPLNLLTTRLCRLRYDHPSNGHRGTNLQWAMVRCPKCDVGGAVSFDATSYHRFWFTCLACEHVWLAPDPSRCGDRHPAAIPTRPRIAAAHVA